MNLPTFRKSYRPRLASTGRWLGLGWFVIPQWNITIGASAKAGTSTLKDFIYENSIECEYLPHHNVGNNVHFIVREPVSRFKSLWRNKCRDGHGNLFSMSTPYPTWRELLQATPEELMTYIESGRTDAHWMNQTKVLGQLPATLIPLDMLDEWWLAKGFGDLRFCHTNETIEDDTEFSNELIQRITTFYAGDVELYNRSVENYSV